MPDASFSAPQTLVDFIDRNKIDLSEVSDDQLRNAAKIIKSANKYELNPDFPLTMSWQESQFKSNAKNPKSSAFGPMQLIDATATGLGVDSTDVDQNIDGGMRLIKELMANKRIGNDSNKVLAGYFSGPSSKFIDTGNFDDLNDDEAKHFSAVFKLAGKDELPSLAPPAVDKIVAKKAADENSIRDTISNLPLPAQAAITGVLGAHAAGAAAAIPYGTYRGGKAAIEFVGSLLDRARAGKEANVATRIDPNLAGEESTVKGSPKGGAAGWLAGRTGDLAAVPEALTSEVSTLKGHGPGSASYAEAQNAANIQRQIAAGEPLTAWRPESGGRILTTPPSGGGSARTFTAPSIQQQARGSTQLTPHIGGKPAPVAAASVAAAPVAAPEAVPNSFKQAVEYAKAVAKNPIAKAMTVGGS